MENSSLTPQEREMLETLRKRLDHSRIPAYNRCWTPRQDSVSYLAAVMLRLDDGEEINLAELEYAVEAATWAEKKRRQKIAADNRTRRILTAC